MLGLMLGEEVRQKQLFSRPSLVDIPVPGCLGNLLVYLQDIKHFASVWMEAAAQPVFNRRSQSLTTSEFGGRMTYPCGKRWLPSEFASIHHSSPCYPPPLRPKRFFQVKKSLTDKPLLEDASRWSVDWSRSPSRFDWALNEADAAAASLRRSEPRMQAPLQPLTDALCSVYTSDLINRATLLRSHGV